MYTEPKVVVFGFVVASTALVSAALAETGERVCPVCGQSFADSVKTCPNDGSDLSLVGRPVGEEDSEPAEGEEAAREDADAHKEEKEDKTGKYKRHDMEGKRQRETKSGTPDYSDRRSRIVKERRGQNPIAEKRRRQAETDRLRMVAELDEQLRGRFEQSRSDYWEDRRQVYIEGIRAEQSRAAARMRQLYGLGAPLASVGFRLAWMGEADDAGLVSATEIDLNLSRHRIRTGLSTLIGVRTLDPRKEILFLEHISVGIQLPWRFSPYIVFRGGIGALASERFEENLVYFVTALGGEAGIDCWVTPWIVVTPGFGYVRFTIDEAYWNSFTAKFSVGF